MNELKRYAKLHPFHDLKIEYAPASILGPHYSVIDLWVEPPFTVCTYSRERDAKRALVSLAYKQEGHVWRKYPKGDYQTIVEKDIETTH